MISMKQGSLPILAKRNILVQGRMDAQACTYTQREHVQVSMCGCTCAHPHVRLCNQTGKYMQHGELEYDCRS